MPDKKYFAGLFGAFLLGLIALILAALAFIFILPLFVPLAVVFAMGIVAVYVFIIVWGIFYFCMYIGVFLYYLGKPMKVKKEGSYRISKAKEAGKRQKGRSKK